MLSPSGINAVSTMALMCSSTFLYSFRSDRNRSGAPLLWRSARTPAMPVLMAAITVYIGTECSG